MNRSIVLWCAASVLALVLTGAGTVCAQERVSSRVTWDRLFTGTRADALGQADFAAGETASAGLLTPAPLPGRQGLALDYGRMGYVADIHFHHAGLAADMGHFRLAVARAGLGADDVPVRTAYDPEGTGETVDLDDRVVVVSGSVDVAGLLAPGRAWAWTVGFAHRRYRFGGWGEVDHASGIDFGSSARRVFPFAGGRFSVDLAGVVTNVGESELAPHVVRAGGAVQFGFDGTTRRDVVTVRLALAWTDDLDDRAYFDDHRWGAELVLMRALAVRAGYHDAVYGGSHRYGLGLQVPPAWLGGWSAAFDWCSIDRGELIIADEDFTAFSLRVAAPLWGGVVRGAPVP